MQESKLLSGLVNKLGDPSRKIASKAGYLLASLLQEHPAMKVIVVAEVQRLSGVLTGALHDVFIAMLVLTLLSLPVALIVPRRR